MVELACGDRGLPPRGVIYAWAMDDIGCSEPASVASSLDATCLPFLDVARGLSLLGGQMPRRIWIVTRGARSGRVAWQFIQDLAGRLGSAVEVRS